MDKRRKESLKARAANIPLEKQRQYWKTSKANAIAARTYACEICDVVFLSTPALDLHKATKKHIDMVAGTYKVPERDCEVCHESFPTARGLARHKLTSKHLNKVAGVSNNKYTGGPRCKVCDATFEKQSKLEKHKLTKRHIKKAAAAAVNKASGDNRVLKFPGAAAAKRAKAAAAKRATAANIAARKYHCSVCDHTFGCKAALAAHYRAQKHKDKAAAAAESESSS
jgi:cytochrome c556